MAKIRIVTDGTIAGTYVYDDNGKMLPGNMTAIEAVCQITADNPNGDWTAKITFAHVEMDVRVEAPQIEPKACPACGWPSGPE